MYVKNYVCGHIEKLLIKKEEIKMFKKEELERMTWEEFLDRCDASHYYWSWYPEGPDEVVKEEGNFLIVKVDISDDPDTRWWGSLELDFLGDDEVIVDWGVPVLITDFEKSTAPYAYMVVEIAEKGYLPVSGVLHYTLEEAEEELKEILEEE